MGNVKGMQKWLLVTVAPRAHDLSHGCLVAPANPKDWLTTDSTDGIGAVYGMMGSYILF